MKSRTVQTTFSSLGRVREIVYLIVYQRLLALFEQFGGTGSSLMIRWVCAPAKGHFESHSYKSISKFPAHLQLFLLVSGFGGFQVLAKVDVILSCSTGCASYMYQQW
jgi:hypothetical protein